MLWFHSPALLIKSEEDLKVETFYGVIIMFVVLFCMVGAVVALLYYLRMLFSKQKKNTRRIYKLIELKRRERRYHLAKGNHLLHKNRQPKTMDSFV